MISATSTVTFIMQFFTTVRYVVGPIFPYEKSSVLSRSSEVYDPANKDKNGLKNKTILTKL